MDKLLSLNFLRLQMQWQDDATLLVRVASQRQSFGPFHPVIIGGVTMKEMKEGHNKMLGRKNAFVLKASKRRTSGPEHQQLSKQLFMWSRSFHTSVQVPVCYRLEQKAFLCSSESCCEGQDVVLSPHSPFSIHRFCSYHTRSSAAGSLHLQDDAGQRQL